ncbi:hypothetical protein [Phyllobacterium myrsinacearum]|uniref:DUF945 domain-containing protein n=1 Tax=Phyllobacterium myrsinacearum TaxID=28101 RepID=A0A839EI14_9HYPH|nr:hypothetical protein [Phyllobacterium myrsinacearum]MBA8876420.1 hypothetical protein [Phyllobacterium myrsinacearum]
MPSNHSLKSGLRLMAATTALVVVFAGSAYAVDGNAVAARLKSAYGEQGNTLEYSNVETNGSTVIIKDTKVTSAGMKKSVSIGDVTLNDVSDASDGGFKIGSLGVPDVNFSPEGEADSKIVVEGIKLEGITLPAEGVTDPLAKLMQCEKGGLKHLNINAKGKDVFTAENLSFTVSPLTASAPVVFTSNLESFKADLSGVEDPKTKDALKALGYETVSGKIDFNGSWNIPDGRFNIDKFDFIADQVGTLGLKFDISGYTLDFLNGLKDAVKKGEGKTDEAQGMAMLGLMQQLSFTGASIRFDDGSVTNKALDYAAKQQGMKRDDLVNQGKAILPMMAAQLGNAEFAQALGTAVSAYLDDPKNIEIKAAPGKSVPFAIIAAGGMADPKSLIKTLGVTVNANQ